MRRYTVTEIDAELDRLLKGRYPVIEVEGEVSQVAVPGSGHAYLLLTHERAVLGAVAWRDVWRNLDHRPVRGEQVVVRGRLGVFPGKGNVQLYVSHIARAGEGRLAREIARRLARLQAEGLTDPRRKRALPAAPRFVGVATSATGAALQDFLKVSRERYPSARILLAACQVQGERAAGSVIQALDLLIEDGRAEVVVVTRGGGSKDDLLAFQDEYLARAIAHCPVPVVSAVGHQIDTTLADHVADRVAPTPSAAAVAVLPDGPALAQRVDEAAVALEAALRRRVRGHRERLDALRARLRHPGERLRAIRSRADALQERLQGGVDRLVRQRREALDRAAGRLAGPPARRLADARARLAVAEGALAPAVHLHVRQARAQVASLSARAHALSPQAVLARGYAVVVGPGGVVRDAGQVAAGDALSVRLARGRLGVVVRDHEGSADPDGPR